MNRKMLQALFDNCPVVQTFATVEPVTDTTSPDATIETFAGPPALSPAIALAKSTKNCVETHRI